MKCTMCGNSMYALPPITTVEDLTIEDKPLRIGMTEYKSECAHCGTRLTITTPCIDREIHFPNWPEYLKGH